MAAPEIRMDDAPVDVDALAARYRGPARVLRLKFVAETSPANAKRAYELAIETIKAETCNTDLYKYITAAASGRVDAAHSFDAEWYDRVERTATARRVALEKDLQLHSTNQIRENIRVSGTEIKCAACPRKRGRDRGILAYGRWARARSDAHRLCVRALGPAPLPSLRSARTLTTRPFTSSGATSRVPSACTCAHASTRPTADR
jgi:hypothetical protein